MPFSLKLDRCVHLCDISENIYIFFVEIVSKENMWMFFDWQQHAERNTVKTKCSHYFCSKLLFSRYFSPCPIL